MQSQIKVKGVNEPLEPYFDQNKYYNHGDNPIFKNFMKIAMQNLRGGYTIDHRTHVIDRGQRLIMARNWEDILQRDLKADSFTKAFLVFVAISIVVAGSLKTIRKILPVGKFGIRNVSQTPFYHNFGPVGVSVLGLWGFGALYIEYKTFKFTLNKFYRHIIQGQRNWLMIGKTVSYYGHYEYDDELLSNEGNFPDSVDAKIAQALPAQTDTFTWEGPYGASKDK